MDMDKVYKFPAELDSKRSKMYQNFARALKFIFIRQYMTEYYK